MLAATPMIVPVSSTGAVPTRPQPTSAATSRPAPQAMRPLGTLSSARCRPARRNGANVASPKVNNGRSATNHPIHSDRLSVEP